jgi:hypothetical protein
VPISLLYDGDHNFNVTGESFYFTDTHKYVEVWVLEDVDNPDNIVWYEKNTGIFTNGSFDYTTYIPIYGIPISLLYELTLTDTNAEFQYFFYNTPPELINISSNPSIGEKWETTFNFTAVYLDKENDAPNFINITINESEYLMIKANSEDENYIDGCIYYYTATFDEVGAFEFRIRTSDGYDGIESNISDFTVIDTIAPDLIIISPQSLIYNSSSISINATSSAADVDTFWYTLFWIELDDWIGDPNGTILVDGHQLVDLFNGSYIITIYINDTEGNVNFESIYFYVDSQIIPGYPMLIIVCFTVAAIVAIIFVKKKKLELK